jgi:hydroxymethylglutaryl-CoA lyase
VRGYVSCVIACPYEGAVDPGERRPGRERLLEMGCYEISLGDTIGAGTPASMQRLLEACAAVVPIGQLAGHYHDTYGMAIANIYASLELGMAVFDSSVAGLGGCPVCGRRHRQRGDRRSALSAAGAGNRWRAGARCCPRCSWR